MSDGKDNLVLFPATLDYYQIELTRMLESERYGDAKALLALLLKFGGEAARHHTEWLALLGWLDAAFPDAEPGQVPPSDEEEEDEELSEEDIARRSVADRSREDDGYIPRMLDTLRESDDPERQMLVIGQLGHVVHPEVEQALRSWLSAEEHHPTVQFRALQSLRRQGAEGTAEFARDGERYAVDVRDVPLAYEQFPVRVSEVLERVLQSAEISDPTLGYFAEQLWKECVQAAFGTPIYGAMNDPDEGTSDAWSAALHQLLVEQLHAAADDADMRERYGITGELRFRYEQALRWLRQYAGRAAGARS